MPQNFEVDYDHKSMPFRRLASYSGLCVPLFALGSWLTMGGSVTGGAAKEIIKTAFENGINFFDLAENYSKGKAEKIMRPCDQRTGVQKERYYRCFESFLWCENFEAVPILTRQQLKNLSRLQMNYVDIMFAHRSDLGVPMEEVVRAFNYIIEKGWTNMNTKAFYWGTFEWSAEQIEEALHKFICVPILPARKK
ncbi:Aldo/keto reductase [Dendrothele bispora CBS 962.96]|uniref:Aldo/keto reductase n=1 Tax=Dendrothele bispora (strain CBS 962.96) TaxID=1314807 RepID=A0A4S8MJK7_DENBC|nr:Aldo/keto reductase [Dendrothele bispora CBS 962.96]